MPPSALMRRSLPPSNPAVATYSFNGMDLRVVEIDGEPWFHATDAGRLLGLQVDAGMVRHLGTLNPDEMRKENKATLNLIEGWAQKAWLISESGLYKLVMRSDKKEAKQFQDWVTREVLPSIRKTGTYTMPGAKKTIEAPKGQINI